jgi:drug/metabolite transporter (DMT)-like permease
MKALITFIYLIVTTSGMIFMKLGGNSLSLLINKGLEFKIGGLTLLGFALYAVSFLLWQHLLVTFDLSYIVPLTTGIVQILTLIIGALIFKENINIYSIFGVLLIIAGVVLISINKVLK